ncbi:MepB protein [Staphylococcus debuckii]|nr:MepB protein [Staphylococcus debuckii]
MAASLNLTESAIGTLKEPVILIDKWNKEYEAFDFRVSNEWFKCRLAKKTPKKKGYFLALWKKNDLNKNMPLQLEDIKGKVIINIVDENQKGQFIFTKDILEEKGILATEKHKGKMAFRVYPTWETELNNTALKTQKWQQDYFVDLSKKVDKQAIERLYFDK